MQDIWQDKTSMQDIGNTIDQDDDTGYQEKIREQQDM
jgi:hypothetical protein